MTHNKFNKNIKLFIHMFPSTEFDWNCIQMDEDKKVLHIRDLAFHNTPKFWKFRTDGIFSNCCQSDVYATTMNEIMGSVFLGIDHVVMSYGQNNSGKTFLLSGLHNQFNLRGLVPRFVCDLFMQKDILQDEYKFTMYISEVDIYNNSIFDLLATHTTLCKQPKQIKQVRLNSLSHCFYLIFNAESRRKCLDNKSYRSHLGSNIITFTIKMNSSMNQKSNDKISKIHFIDLAGVETVRRNQLTSFKDQQSQGDANTTKTLLEIFALRCQKSKNMSRLQRENVYSVNQRTHMLTKYLGESFNPHSKKTFFCHIRPNHEDLMITISLLKFGLTFKFIPIENPEIHLQPNTERIIDQLKERVESLEKQVLITTSIKNTCNIEVSQGRIEFVRRLADLFLKGEVSQLELLSMVDDCSLTLAMIKSIINEKSDTTNAETQTDYVKERFSFSKKSFIEKTIEEFKMPSLDKRLSSPNNKESHIKRVSFKQSKDIDKLVNKTNTKSNEVGLTSQEVQVNLIEPNFKMPTIESREHNWSIFMISMPEIQEKLEKLILSVGEKYKTFNASKLKYDNVQSNIIETRQKLNELECSTYIKNLEENGDRLDTVDKESKLLKELKLHEKELEVSKQSLIYSQIEWLDALQNMSETKKNIEQEFKQFCSLHNFVTLDNMDSIKTEPEKSTNIQLSVQNDYNYLEDLYNDLQKKYLHKL